MKEEIFDFRRVVGKQEGKTLCPRCGISTERLLIISDGTEGEEHTYFLCCDRCKTWVTGSDK